MAFFYLLLETVGLNVGLERLAFGLPKAGQRPAKSGSPVAAPSLGQKIRFLVQKS